MLSFLAFSLLAVEKTHGTDDAISPSHDPSECVVCPLAHGPASPCADLLCAEYSDYDYDYNDYDYDEDPAPAAMPEVAAPEISSNEDYYTDDSWYGAEEDWYGEDVADGADELSTTEPATSDEAAAVDTDVSSDFGDLFDESFEDYAYDGDEGVGTLVDDFGDEESYEALADGERADAGSEVEYEDFEYYSGYESYEDVADAQDREAEAIGIQSEPEVIDCFEGYDSYEEFMQSEEAAAVTASEAATDAVEAVDVEREWASEDYGYYEYGYSGESDQNIEEYEFDAPSTADLTEDVDAADEESLQTGYDNAYDDAMNSDAIDVPTSVEESSTDESKAIYDEYESYYDAYDELYNFESDEADYTDADCHLGPVIAEFEAAEENPLEELAANVIRSVMQELSTPSPAMPSYGCDWDCEAEYWTEPTEAPSVILNAAQGLDNAALALQDAADFLRRIASGGNLLAGRASADEIAR
jgi:hypothetical protein